MLADVEAGADRVDRHSHLAAEAGREREACRPRGGRKGPLARERLAGAETAAGPDEQAGGPLRDAEPAALPLGEGGNGEVVLALEQGRDVAVQIGVDEQ